MTNATRSLGFFLLSCLILIGINSSCEDKLERKERLLFTGSSSIQRWETLDSDFKQYSVINTGVGNTTMDYLLDNRDSLIFVYDPWSIVIYSGDNDLAKLMTPEIVLSNAIQLREAIHDYNSEIDILFISAKPSRARWVLHESFEEFNELLKFYCDTSNNVYFVDIWFKMLDEAGFPNKDLFLEDTLHINRSGYVIWADAIRECLEL